MSAMRWAAAVLLSTLLLSSPAMAQAQGKGQAQQLFKEGNQLYRQKQYEQALAKYQEAYEQQPRPSILLNIAATLERLDRPLEAAETYQQYLEHPKAKPDKKARAKEALTKLDKKLAHIEVQPAGAMISIDGRPVERVPKGGLRVMPGTYNLTAEKKGYGRVSLDRQFDPAERYVIELPAAPKEPSADRETVAGTSEPKRTPLPGGAEEPREPAEPPPAQTKEAPPPEKVTPPPEKAVVTPPEPPAKPKPNKALRNAAIGVGVVALATAGAGAGLIGSVYPTYNRLQRECPTRPGGGCGPEELRGPQLRANLGYALVAIGGAAAIADIVLIVKAARQGKSERPKATGWWLAPSGMGMAAGGTF
jgi:hypothetical protein